MMTTFNPININLNNVKKIKIKVDFVKLWNAKFDDKIAVRNTNSNQVRLFTIIGVENINSEKIYAVIDTVNGIFEIVEAPAKQEPINYADYCKQVFMDVFGFDPDADEKTQMAQIMESLGYKQQPKKKVVRTPFGNVYVNE